VLSSSTATELQRRLPFGVLLVLYVSFWLLSGHGPSERGGVLLLELVPPACFALQAIWPTQLVWWLLTVFASLYTIAFAAVGLLTSGFSDQDFSRFIALVIIWIALLAGRPRGTHRRVAH